MSEHATPPVARRPNLQRYALSAADAAAELAYRAERATAAPPAPGRLRAGFDAMVALCPSVVGVGVERWTETDLSGSWLRPARSPEGRAILFLHGGGYTLGSASSFEGFAGQIAARAGIATFAAEYPLAPEHPFPAAFDAACGIARALAARGIGRLALAGDSAGGGLALALAATLGSEMPEIAAVAAFSPWTDLAVTGPSLDDPATVDPIFRPAMIRDFARTYLAGADPRDGRASPLYAIPVGLPPLLLQVGEDELLLDDAIRFAEVSAARGAEVTLEVYEGLHHVFQLRPDRFEAAAAALDRAAEFLAHHLAHDQPRR